MLAFNIEENFIVYKLVLGGIFFITFFSVNRKNLIFKYFLLFLFLFFISTLIFEENINVLKYSSFYSSLSVNSKHIEWIYFLFSIYLLSVHFTTILYKEVSYSNYCIVNCKRLKNKNFFFFIITILSVIVFNFYIDKIIAIQDEGYLSYHTGELSIKKGLYIIVGEVLFLAVLYWLLYHRSKLGILLFFVYNIFILLTGFRMPFISNILVFWILYYPLSASKFKLIFMGFLLSPPILILSQRYRMGNFPSSFSNASEIILNSYSELFSILNFTLDTVKAAVYLRFDTEETSSIFYGIKVLFVGLYKKITSGEYLTVSEKIDYGSFAVISTNKINPHLISEGISAGSSFLAEVFLPFGVIGVIAAGFFHVIFVNKIVFFFHKKNFLGFLILIVLAPHFLRSTRSGFIDWIFISFIYISIFYIVIVSMQSMLRLFNDSAISLNDSKNV
jgi:hypothetical protein